MEYLKKIIADKDKCEKILCDVMHMLDDIDAFNVLTDNEKRLLFMAQECLDLLYESL